MEKREPVIKILYENTTRPVNRVLLTFPLSGREKPEQKMLSLTRGHEGKSSIPFRITKVESPIPGLEQELSGLKEEWKEIAAHGWGDLFASRTLNAGNIRFHAGFWDTERGENLSLMTEEEFGREVGGFEIRM